MECDPDSTNYTFLNNIPMGLFSMPFTASAA